jgi:hypothetical protein
MRYGSRSLYSCESSALNWKPGGKDGRPACINGRQGVALAAHHCAAAASRGGEHLGCGLKARNNKPAQRQRGQHKDIFPCITQHRAWEQHVAQWHTQILIWSRRHRRCLFCIAWFGSSCAMALLVNVMNCLRPLGGLWLRSRFLPCRTLTIDAFLCLDV